jgi:diguanylate cyclase (GGDEF)-like protein
MTIKKKEDRIYRTYILTICLVSIVLLSGLFLSMTMRTRSLIMDELLASSRAKHEMIVAMREWNSMHGGVYVEKRTGIESNPFLDNPDRELKDGNIVTLRNPAIMTREVSDVLEADNKFSFHLTSKKYLNPANKPNEFEVSALDQFEAGKDEVYEITRKAGEVYFSYIRPLYITENCLQCHAKLGYSLGDVRGGISITSNVGATYNKMRFNVFLVFIFSATILILFLLIFWIMTTRLISKLAHLRQRIEEMATVDDLTKVFNRRYVNAQLIYEHERALRTSKRFSCLSIDIDNFKKVNDTYGHSFGDEVLIEVASRMNTIIRGYDVLGRFGGEEFMVILPETELEDARSLAERVRLDISEEPTKGVSVTVSIGVATMNLKGESIDDFLRRVDTVLYEAKAAGKNCVISSNN